MVVLVIAGAVGALVYGLLARSYFAGARRRVRLGVLIVTVLVSLISIATIVGIAIPVAIITVWTWRWSSEEAGVATTSGWGD